jgi:hypothetical protein
VENKFWTWEHILLVPEKTFQNIKINLNKNSTRICQHYMCTRQVSLKIEIFMSYVKKRKCLVKVLFLSNKKYLFTHDTKNASFPRNDFVSTYNVEMCAPIFWSIFQYFKLCLKIISKKGAHAPGCRNASSINKPFALDMPLVNNKMRQNVYLCFGKSTFNKSNSNSTAGCWL